MTELPAIPSASASASAIGILVALGSGLLIGLERERRKGEGDDRAAAGIRTFSVAALCGALAQALGGAGLVLAGALLVAALTALAYFRSRSRDPGLTTELALFATYLIGVEAVVSPPLGAACGAGLAVLLAARLRLHRFATRLLSAEELHDGLTLAGLGLVVLPLIPNLPLTWLGGINPRPLASMVLLILLLQALGHVALRLAGPRFGLAAAGFFSGFVSSTATVASLGGRARGSPELTVALAGGAVFSSAATWLLVMVLAAAQSPDAARKIAPLAGAGLACALLVGGALLRLTRDRPSGPGGSDPAASEAPGRGPLRLREAFIVAALLAGVTLAVAWASRYHGQVGVSAMAALAGLADAHSPVASVVALFAAGKLSARELVQCVLLALTSNSATRVVVAFTAGGRRYGVRVSAGLLTALAAAWGMAALTL